MAEQVLSGVKVLDLTWYIAGPFCTKLFADYGAEVVKIEKPGTGDPARHMGPFLGDDPHLEKSLVFSNLNLNKKSIVLDLKADSGREAVCRMVEGVDILVESFSPGVMDRLGLGYDRLRRINPSLIMTSISNFGQAGPYRDFKASELVLSGMGADMYSCGVPGRHPLKLARCKLRGAASDLHHAGKDAEVILLDCDFRKDAISFNQLNGIVTVQWTVEVEVRDQDGQPCPDRTVNAESDPSCGLEERAAVQTDARGRAQLVLTEFIADPFNPTGRDGINNKTPHQIWVSGKTGERARPKVTLEANGPGLSLSLVTK